MPRTPYPSDLTDAQWRVLAPMLPAAKPGGRPRKHDLRDIVDAMRYVLRGGIASRALPHGYPPWPTVYGSFRASQHDGTWERLNDSLRTLVRQRAGRKPQPFAAILDCQSAKTTVKGEPRGYDGAKKLNGRKRHLLVDTGALVLRAVVHPANVPDREGAGLVLEGITQRYPHLTHLWVDAGYAGTTVADIGQAMGLTVQVVRRPRRWVWWPTDQEPPPMPTGFQVLPRRWVVERTFAWLGRWRCLSKDYEEQPTTEGAWISIAMCMLMLAWMVT